MSNHNNYILDIVIKEVNLINEKIKGLNFLEILKTNIIEKIQPVVNNSEFQINNLIEAEKIINTDSRNIKILVKLNTNSFVNTKKLIEEDTLFIVFNEASSFDVYRDDKNFVNIILHKNTGISLSKNTLINSNINKNVLIIEIQNKDIEQTLTN